MGSNRLGAEKSPYLLQHKDNPVWWYPWGTDAFEAAKKEGKPIFLSIGYSTCHWCHVMEKDSFEKTDVAKVLNEKYISVKVDREEQPDVDSVYMSAVQAMTGGGGWPLSALLTPDGSPFWTGTFVPHDSFIDLLEKVSELWLSQQGQVLESASKVFSFLKEGSSLPPLPLELNLESLDHFVETFKKRFDHENGGSEGAPKFPQALALSLSLRIYRRTKDAELLKMVQKTLDEMRRGGIYDQVGGGFHRYSTDEKWLIPHFEKMLYDNALLTNTYLEAFQVTHNPDYAQTARETLDYVLRDMTSPEGGFYSAEDADSESIEGKFYVWNIEELKNILSEKEFEEIQKTFNVTPDGNFEAHKTGDEVGPGRHGPPAIKGNHFYLKSGDLLPKNSETLKKLLKVREKRIRPHLDDKVLTSWNGLMITAFAKGYQILGDQKYLEAAQRAAHFILAKLRTPKKELLRRYRDGEAAKDGLADDYAFFINALLHLYESDFDPRWFAEAKELTHIFEKDYWDEKNGAYFENNGKDAFVIVRNQNFEDGVVPSSNSVAAWNGLKLYALTGDANYKNKTEKILQAASALIAQYPNGTSKLLQSLDWIFEKPFEVAVAGGLWPKELWQKFYPNGSYACRVNPNQTEPPLIHNRFGEKNLQTFYLCRGQECLLPTHNLKDVFSKLEG